MTRKASEGGPKHPEPRRRPTTRATHTSSRRKPVEAPTPPPPSQSPSRGLGSLLRGGAGSFLGHVSGIAGVDDPASGFERIARSLERGAAFLDRAEAELGFERLAVALERLELLSDILERRDELDHRLQRLLSATERIDQSMRTMTALAERQLAAIEGTTTQPVGGGATTPVLKTKPRRGAVKSVRDASS